MGETLDDRDDEFLARHDITSDDAQRQVDLLRAQQFRVKLSRPCTIGDGISVIAEHDLESLSSHFESSVRDGRWLKFVPASGAASRMFDLKEADAPQRFCNNLPAFAFYEDLLGACRRNDQDLTDLVNRQAYAEILAALVGAAGLNYSFFPKALLKFHRYSSGSRTPFEEHLREAAQCFQGGDGRCHLHFTVSKEHVDLFRALLDQLRPVIKQQLDSELEVSFSVQKPSTDTLALEADDRLLRDEDRQIVLRPGGHGALLENLMDLQDADLVFIKNIDNVCHQRISGPTQTWIRALGGYLVRLQSEAMQSDNRPLRVCGMVRNEGEPGGGPFWVREADGSESVQIVEKAEVDKDNADQVSTFNQATHFNPVFMALAVRNRDGVPSDLHNFVNPSRFILTTKVEQGRQVRVLERPGLWNGAMHDWQTVFIEVPKEVFSPVKTVFDLLRDEHQHESA